MKKVALGDMCNPSIGQIKELPDTIIDYIDISSVDNQSKTVTGYQTMRFSESPSRARKAVKKGNILVSTVRPNLNAVAMLEENTPNKAVASTGFCILDCKENTDSRFVFNFCKSKTFIDEMVSQATGASYPAVTDKIVRSALVPAYSYNEQRRISGVLDSVSSIIEKRKKELCSYDELIKARFVEMFGNIRENRFPKCKLKDVAHIKHGYAFSGEFFSDEDNGIVLVTPGNFAIGGGFQEIKNRYFTSDYDDEYVLHPGDLIVTMTDLSKKADTLGYGAIVPNSEKVYLHNQRIGLFDYLDDKLNPVFVRWYMQTDEYRLEIVRTSTGSTVHHTSPDRILNSIIYLPPIEDQNKFVAFAEQVDKSKAIIQKSLNEEQFLFNSLMQEYFG